MASRFASFLLLALVARPTLAQAPSLTLDQVVNAGPITGSAPGAMAWSPDGRTLAFTWDSAGGGRRAVWVVGHDGRGRRVLLPAAGGSARELAWRPGTPSNGGTLLLLRGEALERVRGSDGATERVAALPRDAHALGVSPDGRHASFLSAGDLWVVALTAAEGAPRRVTMVGLPSIAAVPLGTYARLDREVGDATWGSAAPPYAWAPDGRTVAVQVVDRRAVRQVAFPYPLGRDPAAEPLVAPPVNLLRRSYPGDVNESRSVALVDVATGAMTPIPFPEPTEVQLLNLAWSRQGALLVDRERDDATERWVHVVAPGTAPRLVYHDRRATRIYTEHGSAWADDGASLLLTTDRDDRYRVFRVALGDTTPVALTPATSDVQGAAWPLSGGSVAWLSSAPVVAERHLWVRRGATAPVQVTQRAGTHRVVMAPDGRTAASVVSDDVTPPQLLLSSLAGGAEVAVTTAGGPALAAAGLVAPRYVRFAGADAGDTLHAKVWLPAAAARGARVPVVFGPVYSNTVRNRWGGTYGLLQQLLVQRGYAVIQVDVRGSTGYGRAFREAFLFEWGGRDLDDLAATRAWLATQGWADTARLGIFGSSYGGLISVYAMLRRPGLFHAAVAGASAVDPRFFGSDDVAITRRPGTHPAAFARGAAQHAGGLAGHLMLIHGMMDDVVPFHTAADLAEALMRAGKDFDLVVAPGATHGWTQQPHHARYLLGKLLDHFARWLPAAP
jgi:dipeptidyl-peptidase-4